MYTRCPYCHTYFKVMAEHIKKAGGKVRCGQCYKVFNSIGNLIEKLPVPLTEKNKSRPSPTPAPAPENKTAAQTEETSHRATIADTAAPQRRTEIPSTPVDGPHLRSNTASKATFSGKDSIESIILSKKDKIRGIHAGPHSPTKDLIVHPTLGVHNDDDANYQNALTWGLGLLLLLLVFVVQYSYFFRGDLAQHAQLKPWIENLCDIANCEIPVNHDIRAIKLTRRDITTHPKVKNALLISAALVNESQGAQPYPVMRIRLSDTTGQILASRNFYPREYLDADINLRKGMPASNPIQINLEIIDPGKNAINFEFDFFYPREL